METPEVTPEVEQIGLTQKMSDLAILAALKEKAAEAKLQSTVIFRPNRSQRRAMAHAKHVRMPATHAASLKKIVRRKIAALSAARNRQ